MLISDACVSLVKKYEGFEAKAYLCPANVWTIGYGTTVYSDGTRVKKGDVITRSKAESLLRKQIQEHANTISKYVTVKLTQNQYDALASFQYNLGKDILKNSTLLKYINNAKWTSATNTMKLYNKGGGKVLKGLVTRRAEEVKLFLTSSEVTTTDFVLGSTTAKALQRYIGVTADGIVGSETIKALQKHLSVKVDGVLGEGTIKALQKHLGVDVDGILGLKTTTALQTAIVRKTF